MKYVSRVFFQCKLCGSSKVVPKHPVDRRRSPSPTLCSSVSTKPLRFLQLVLDSPALRSRLGCRRESAPLSGSISSLARLQCLLCYRFEVTSCPGPLRGKWLFSWRLLLTTKVTQGKHYQLKLASTSY